MKLTKQTITIKLEDAELKFTRLKANDYHKMVRAFNDLVKAKEKDGAALQLEQSMADYHKAILGTCFEVKNLEHDDGTPVTLEDVKSANLYSDAVEMLVAAYVAASKELQNREGGNEKNGDSANELLKD